MIYLKFIPVILYLVEAFAKAQSFVPPLDGSDYSYIDYYSDYYENGGFGSRPQRPGLQQGQGGFGGRPQQGQGRFRGRPQQGQGGFGGSSQQGLGRFRGRPQQGQGGFEYEYEYD